MEVQSGILVVISMISLCKAPVLGTHQVQPWIYIAYNFRLESRCHEAIDLFNTTKFVSSDSVHTSDRYSSAANLIITSKSKYQDAD